MKNINDFIRNRKMLIIILLIVVTAVIFGSVFQTNNGSNITYPVRTNTVPTSSLNSSSTSASADTQTPHTSTPTAAAQTSPASAQNTPSHAAPPTAAPSESPKIIYTPAPTHYFSNNSVTVIHENFRPDEKLINEIENILDSSSNKCSFYAESLDGKFAFGYNPYNVYFGASTIKAAVALYAYTQIERGAESFDTVLNKESVRSLLFRMIDTSDNDAYAIIRDHFGVSAINAFTRSLGCRQFNINGSWANATAFDAILIWREIYKISVRSEAGRIFMDSLTGAKWNRVADVLPEDYIIAHKYGINDSVYSETSLIMKPSGKGYFFTFYTNANRTVTDTTEDMHHIIPLIDEVMAEYDEKYNFNS